MIKIFIGLAIVLCANASYAFKECLVKTSSLYVGDDGFLWMAFINGGVAYIKNDDIDFERIYSMLLAAQLADKDLIVRYQGDDVQCGYGTRSDIVGVWLNK